MSFHRLLPHNAIRYMYIHIYLEYEYCIYTIIIWIIGLKSDFLVEINIHTLTHTYPQHFNNPVPTFPYTLLRIKNKVPTLLSHIVSNLKKDFVFDY